jgi:acyl-coenzyme A synthetase/AMP-(fatty) acid ligase
VGNAVVAHDDLSRYAAVRLSGHKQPAEWIMVNELPRTSTGKVRKHVLRQWYEDGQFKFA